MVLVKVIALGCCFLLHVVQGYVLVGIVVAVILGRDYWLQSLADPLRGDAASGCLVANLIVGVVLAPCALATGY